MWKYFAIYLVLLNLAALAAMGYDKSRARRRRWRVPEKTLFALALLGGALGGWCGMYLFHHKTRHWYFVVGFPLILAGQCALLWYLRSADFWGVLFF